MSNKLLKSSPGELKWGDWYFFLNAAASGVFSIALAVVGLLVSLLLEAGSGRPEVGFSKPLTYFVGGIVVLAFVVVAVASFMRRQNRSTVLLKRRLSEIYLSALRNSAFNPQLKSRVLDD